MDEPRRGRIAALSDDSRWRWIVPTGVLVLATVTLLIGLDDPARIIFDETYYVNDAREYLEHGVEESFAVHPPVGKWLIATGIALFGDNAFGWRVAGAVTGAVAVLLTYLVARRLRLGVAVSGLAALLLLTDGLFFVQARISMLDIHLAFFVMLGTWLLLVDRQRSGLGTRPEPVPDSFDLTTEEDAADTPPPEPPTRRNAIRLLAGVAFGLAIATKWSGLLGLGAAGLLTLGWELAWRYRWLGRWNAQLGRMVGSVLVALVLVPAGVYLASYVPWLVNYEYTHEGQKECTDEADQVIDPCDVGVTGRLAGLWRSQVAIARFHEGLDATHSYRAPAITWPVMARPVVYYWETCSEDRAAGVARTEEDGEVVQPEPCIVEQGDAAEILAVGNPVLWWGFLAATPLLVGALVRRRLAAAVIAVFYAAQFLPWLVVSRPAFIFYMVPVVPFLALGLAYVTALATERWAVAGTYAGAALGGAVGFGGALLVGAGTDLDVAMARWIALGVGWLCGAAIGAVVDARSPRPARTAGLGVRSGRIAAIVVGGLAVALFAYFLPVWTGIPLEEDIIRQRWWFDGWI